MKRIWLLTICLLAFLTFPSFGDDFLEEGTGSFNEEAGTLVITSVPLSGVSAITGELQNEKGETTEITIDPSGHTALMLLPGTYRLGPDIRIAFDREHGVLNELALSFKAVSADPASMTVTVRKSETSYFGTGENPLSFLYIYEENRDSAGILSEPFTSADLLMEDMRLNPYGDPKEQALSASKLPAPDLFYEESMAAYIREVCEEENIPVPDDSLIGSCGFYGNDPFGSENSYTDESPEDETDSLITETESPSPEDEETDTALPEEEEPKEAKGKNALIILSVSVFAFLCVLFTALSVSERIKK